MKLKEVECCKEKFISRPAFSKYMHKHLYSVLSGESQTEMSREKPRAGPPHTHWSSRKNPGTLNYSITFLSVHTHKNSHLTKHHTKTKAVLQSSGQKQNFGCSDD